ncbi:hypothetical protein [Shewanella algae]|uniref:hypothetical protein n=1 Tax=Shewanella algae TaxID=38313 RepID=UPI001AADD05F|nr:hypothetical protein [Shewanella algae]MBO2557891.1 hypothetical protein [Shewanella algae]MBO2574827.1 hypothetical protein [Shewanella algae]
MGNNNITVEKHNVAPYLSVLLGAKSTKEESCSVHEIILQLLQEESSDEMSVGSTVSDELGELGTVKITSYTISKDPSWAKGLELKDLEHHVFVSFNVRQKTGQPYLFDVSHSLD